MLSTSRTHDTTPNNFQGSSSTTCMVIDVSRGDSTTTSLADPGGEPGPEWLWERCVSLLPLRHLICSLYLDMYLPLFYYIKADVCLLYEMLYPCSCNVVISC